MVGRDVIDLVTFSDWAEEGHLPVAGGVLDQAAGFLAASEFYQNEKRKIENERIS
jgi:hypothetical protein